MKIKSVTAFLFAAVLLIPHHANADQDTISQTSLGFGDTADLFFPNTVLPPPSRKVLQFNGDAQSFGVPGTAAILGIHFDYTDDNGNTVIVPSPNFYQEAIQTETGLVPISAGPVILPFCPEEVSIHFENLTPDTEIVFTGVFDHTCIPIPEPGTAMLLLVVGLAGVSGMRRRG